MFVQLGDVKILVDCGLHPKKVGRIAAPDFSPLRGHELDLIILTHCHLDHLGSLPLIMREHPKAAVVMSPPSAKLVERMLHNSANVMLRQREDENIPDYPLFTHSDIDRLAKRFTPLPFGHAKTISSGKDQVTFIFHPAGHVAGAAAVELHHKDRKIFFTGDVLFEPQRTLSGARFPMGHFDVVVTETTRGTTERPVGKDRASEVVRLVNSINTTIQRGGSFIVPVFALGRMQEILAILHDARKFGKLVDCPVFTGGLGIDLCDYFDEISRKSKLVNFQRSILKDLKTRPFPRNYKPGSDPQENAIYILSSGMLVERTPAYNVASGLVGHARNTVAFVGYCDPDTPGGKLLASQPGDNFLFETAHVRTKVKANIERFELSGHADRTELLDYAAQCTPHTVVLTHGDPPARAWFAQQFAIKLPQAKIIDPVPLQPYEV